MKLSSHICLPFFVLVSFAPTALSAKTGEGKSAPILRKPNLQAPRPQASDPDHTQVAKLKDEIRQLAIDNQGRCTRDTNHRIRESLEAKIQALVALMPTRPAPEQMPDLVGSWRQLWSDGPSGSAPGSCLHSDQIFEVFFPNGYYWDLAKETSSAGQVLTRFMRGQYELREPDLLFVLTKKTSKPGFLEVGDDVISLAMQAEVGAFDDQVREGDPIGRFGALENVYVDEDLRITRGGGPQFGGVYLYILTRQSQVQSF